MMKEIILISWLLCQTLFCGIFAQSLVLPYVETGGYRSVSDDGTYMTVLSNEGLLSQVDIATGSVICSEKIDIKPGGQVFMKSSFYGNYVMIINCLEELEVLSVIYRFTGLEGFDVYSNYVLDRFYYTSDAGMLVIESNQNEDFILKMSSYPQSGAGNSSFRYYTRYINTDDWFRPQVEFGYISDSEIGEIEGTYLSELQGAECRAYDVTESEKNVLMLSNYQIDKNNSDDHGDYAYGIWNWEIKGGKTGFKRLFNDTEFECNNEFCEGYSLEYGAFTEMRMDEANNRIYGHGNTKEILKKICIDFQVKRGDAEFDEQLYQEVCDYYRATSNSVIPFIYDISDNQFLTVFGNRELIDPDYRKTFSYPLPAKFRYGRISFDLKHALYVCEKSATEVGFYRLNLKTGEVDSAFAIIPANALYGTVVTNDNKAVIWDYSQDIDDSTEREKSLILFDFEMMRIKSRLVITEANQVLRPTDVTLYSTEGSANLLISTSSGHKLDFSFGELPFFRTGPDLDSALVMKERYDSLIPRWVSYEIEHYDGIDIYQHSYIEVMEFYDIDAPSPFNYHFESHEIILSRDYLYKIDDDEDKIDDSCYVNVLYSLKTDLEFHALTKELYVRNYVSIDKFNPRKNQNEFVYIKHKTPIMAFDVLQNDSLMVSLSEDGEINIWNIASNKLLSTLYLFDDGENWVFVLPNNYYYGTQTAIERVAFAFDKVVFPMEFFELRYNRPDKVLTALGSKNQVLINAYHRAYLKRLQKLGLTEDMLKLDYDVPYLHITNKQMIPMEVEADSIQIDLNMYDLRYNLDRINVWVNDVAIFGANGKSIRELGLNFYKTSIQVPLGHGENNIQISILNESGSESPKETIHVNNNGGKKIPDLYLITIGVSKYADERYDLTYAAKDAQDVAKAFEQNEFYPHVYTKILLNEEVTLEKVLDLKHFLKNAGINDQVIVFIAGHGLLDEDINYYFASHDVDFLDPAGRGIPYELIEKLLDGIRPLKKLLLLDTCHSGEVDKDEVVVVESEEEKNGDIVWRAAGVNVENNEVQLGFQNTSELMKNLFTDLRKGTGATVVSSAGGVELAMESATWQNGLFTYCLLNGLTSKTADLNTNNEITVSELKNFVQTQVQLLSGGKQTPTSRIENHALDYRVW